MIGLVPDLMLDIWTSECVDLHSFQYIFVLFFSLHITEYDCLCEKNKEMHINVNSYGPSYLQNEDALTFCVQVSTHSDISTFVHNITIVY